MLKYFAHGSYAAYVSKYKDGLVPRYEVDIAATTKSTRFDDAHIDTSPCLQCPEEDQQSVISAYNLVWRRCVLPDSRKGPSFQNLGIWGFHVTGGPRRRD